MPMSNNHVVAKGCTKGVAVFLHEWMQAYGMEGRGKNGSECFFMRSTITKLR